MTPEAVVLNVFGEVRLGVSVYDPLTVPVQVELVDLHGHKVIPDTETIKLRPFRKTI